MESAFDDNVIDLQSTSIQLIATNKSFIGKIPLLCKSFIIDSLQATTSSCSYSIFIDKF